MLNDFHLITYRFYDKHNITIYPIADIHLGAAEFKEGAWREFCTKILSEEHSYITLGGDLLNRS